MQIVGTIGQKIVMTIVSILIVIWLIVISGFNYVTVKMYGKMPLVVYLVAPYGSAIVTLLVYFLLPAFISVHTKWKDGLFNLRSDRVRKSEERKIAASIPKWGLECGISTTRLFRIEESYKAEFFASVSSKEYGWSRVVVV